MCTDRGSLEKTNQTINTVTTSPIFKRDDAKIKKGIEIKIKQTKLKGDKKHKLAVVIRKHSSGY